MTPPFVALSITTTGPDPRRDRVRAVSAVSVDAAGERTRFEAMVQSAALLALDGNQSTPWPEVAKELRRLTPGRRVVVHDTARSLAVMAAVKAAGGCSVSSSWL